MIYYFHYNNKGSHPFARDWKLAENIEMAELSPEQAQFLVATSKEVKRRRTSTRSLLNPVYDRSLTFGYQRNGVRDGEREWRF